MTILICTLRTSVFPKSSNVITHDITNDIEERRRQNSNAEALVEEITEINDLKKLDFLKEE